MTHRNHTSYQRIVCWIAHCSTLLPLSPQADPIQTAKLQADNWLLSDLFADQVHLLKGQVIKGEYSRFFCDLERYADDRQEEMSQVGMGMLYKRLTDGSALDRNLFDPSIAPVAYYRRKHQQLKKAVEQAANGCLLLDLHTFNPIPLPCDKDQDPRRPDFCIGVNPGDTCPASIQKAVQYLRDCGYKTLINKPFSGSMTVNTEVKYKSVMIEINKRLYLKGQPNDGSQRRCILTGVSFHTVLQGFYDILLEE